MAFDLFGIVLAVASIDPCVTFDSGGVELAVGGRQQVEMSTGVTPPDQHRRQSMRADRAHPRRDVADA